MRQKYLSPLALFLVSTLATFAGSSTITLSSTNTGNYWYEKSQWTGGSDTQTGFSYGDDDTGLIHAHRNYQYYGGSDRFWQRKNAYFQIDLSSFSGIDITSAVFSIYVTAHNSDVATSLLHLNTQSPLATGDAAQQLAGGSAVASSSSFTIGWNHIDVTASIQSDLDLNYAIAAFSLPEFAQDQDVNRILSLYGGSAALEYRPYLTLTASAIPEPATYGLLAAGAVFGLVAYQRQRQKKLRGA
ncbi:MAG: PEP-CTERM sorting domain-containing protein [Opitutaceae bacterium]|nr:PEP-CTERM sorting domain-containing protein [Opitutaceae bacterium]